MSQNYNENLDEGKLPIDFKEDKSNKKLGIILEENNYNNSELEKSREHSKDDANEINKLNKSQKDNSSNKESTVNVQIHNNLLFKEKDEEKYVDKKYNTMNNFSENKITKILKDISNNSNNYSFSKAFNQDNKDKSNDNNNKNLTEKKLNENNSNNESENNKNLTNNHSYKNENKSNEKNHSDNSKDIFILSSNKKKSELIKLLSSNKLDSLGNDSITKNINLNININNNIKYEIEKNTEKDDTEKSDLNKSLHSLLKIAEKNCLNLNDSLTSNIYTKNHPKYNSKLKENKKIISQKQNYLTLETNKTIDSQKIALSLINSKKIKNNKNQFFKRVKSQNAIKNKKISICNIKKNNTIQSLNNKCNNIFLLNKGDIFNKNEENKTIINNNRNGKNNRNIYNKKNNTNNRRYSSINEKNKNIILNKKENNSQNKIKFEKNNNYFKKENNNSLIEKKFEKKSIQKINNYKNYNQFKDKKFGQNNRFFEVDISINNYLKNEKFDNSMDDLNNKIYRRPTKIYNSKNVIQKGKSLDRSNKTNLLNNKEHNPFRKIINQKISNLYRTKTNNYYLNSKDINKIAYIKKNPQSQINNINNINQLNDKSYLIGFNRNTFISNKRNNKKRQINERKSLNNFEIKSKSPDENYNFKKYNDIYKIDNSKYISSKNIFALNIEDLLVLEEKLCEIIIELKKGKKINNQCFDYWNYYFNFSLYQKIEKVFNNETEEEIVRLYFNYELMSILICYEFSFKNEIMSDFNAYLEILQICHKNLILIYEQVLNKIFPENKNNIWVIKLKEIIRYSKNISEQILSNENYINSLIGKINFNTNCLIKKIKNIIYNNYFENKNILVDFVKNLNQKTYEEINDFFKEYCYKVDNFEGSILSYILRNNIDYTNRVCPPYIKEPNLKRYTLVLDLNETLINFKSTKGNQGLVRTRPFLFEFLDSISQFYEIILFTCSTQNYADSIVKAIEYKKKYFDYIFYRQHAMIFKNNFVKDLTRIGRPLNSIIIVDNMPQNFRFQKENGINIKSFWGDNIEDTALYELIPILINIANEKEDVREGLKKYKDEIIKKVSSNLSKHNA